MGAWPWNILEHIGGVETSIASRGSFIELIGCQMEWLAAVEPYQGAVKTKGRGEDMRTGSPGQEVNGSMAIGSMG